MSKNLVIFFDGTWNAPDHRTNVYQLYQATAHHTEQKTLYLKGVGTKRQGFWGVLDKYLGGAFGAGLTLNLRLAYQWLCQNHVSGDRIFLFGFSRGAYSARSLAGMIRQCGLLHLPSQVQVAAAYALYRSGCTPSSARASGFRQQFSRESDIHFLGVWDTVGHLGIPLAGPAWLGFASAHTFHNTELSNHVHHAYHALAANEYRTPYTPTFWTRLSDTSPRPADRPVEQRWFVGAHADVGGGYAEPCLQTLSACWMQQKARQAGLDATYLLEIATHHAYCEPHDSHHEFSQRLRLHVKKHPRQWDTAHVLNLTVDPSLSQRLQSPTFLQDYPEFKQALQSLPVGD